MSKHGSATAVRPTAKMSKRPLEMILSKMVEKPTNTVTFNVT